MTVIDSQGLALWISEQLDLPLEVVEAVLTIEFEFMVGVGIIDLPNVELLTFSREELRDAPPIVDTDQLAVEAEQRVGIMSEVALQILNKEFEFLEMRGLISEAPDPE